jgi:FkbM family methyltransferase
MIDQISLLERLDKVAVVCRRFGLSKLAPAGKNFLKPLIRDRLSVRVGGLQIAASLDHRHYLRALRRGEVDSLMANLFDCVVRPGMAVLDIGAFVGWHTLIAAQQVGAQGRVYAFEGDARNYELLSENLRGNQFDAKVIAQCKAVSDGSGAERIVRRDGEQSPKDSIPFGAESQSNIAESIVLDEFFEPTVQLDVVKIDIDGNELKALKGMRETLHRAAPTVKLFVRCNPVALRDAGETAQSLVDELRRLQFSIFMIDEAKPGLKPLDSTIEAAASINLFCIRV